MKDNKEFIQGIYKKYDEYVKDEKNKKILNEANSNNTKTYTINENNNINNSNKKTFLSKNIKKLSAIAACAVIVSGAIIGNNLINKQTMIGSTKTSSNLSLKTLNDFDTFYKIAKKDAENNKRSSSYMYEDLDLSASSDMIKSSDLNGATASAEKPATSSQSTSNSQSATRNEDYSKTNIQVEDVDEADIVKTNGNYIFYVVQNKIIIVDIKNKNKMEKVAEISFKNENYSPKELFINKDKLIILGLESGYSNSSTKIRETETSIYKKRIYKQKTVAVVFDISEIEEPEEVRRVELEGDYLTSRMINNNIYFVANKTVATNNILTQEKEKIDQNLYKPTYKDTVNSNSEKTIEFDQIYYYEDIDTLNYLTLGGFSLDNKREVNIQTFLGAGEDVYCSDQNMYIVKTKNVYDEDTRMNFGKDTKIIKFALNNGKIEFKAEATVEGGINNQFSMDEANGNFRIATTIGKTYNMDNSTSNTLYILDEKLNEIGRLDGIAKGEKIYSVRYTGDRAYVVTFKEIDPLFVIDLSNIKAPKILGELKIPGYSTYLHPYDETHLIGFGYDTKPNSTNTGVVNDGLKMSMFDITDFSNPKEMFTVKIGEKNTTSELASNHKALLFSKEKNIIAFPVKTYQKGYQYKAQVYDIDLQKGFTLRGEIEHNEEDNNTKYYSNYNLDIDRIIYSKDNFYTLSKSIIKSSNMEDLKEIDTIILGKE